MLLALFIFNVELCIISWFVVYSVTCCVNCVCCCGWFAICLRLIRFTLVVMVVLGW